MVRPRQTLEDGSVRAFGFCPGHQWSTRVTDGKGRFVLSVFPALEGNGDPHLTAWLCTIQTRLSNPDATDRIAEGVAAFEWWGVDAAAGAERDLRAAKALSWSLQGHDVAEALLADSVGVDPAEMRQWAKFGSDPDAMAAWIRAGVDDPYAAHEWRRAGIAPGPVPDGFPAEEHGGYRFVLAGDLPHSPDWGGLRTVCDAPFAATGHAQGRSPAEVRALAVALYTRLRSQRVPGPQVKGEMAERMLATAREAAGLDWFDVAACLRTGMAVQKALEHVRSGADMGPVRLVAALAA